VADHVRKQLREAIGTALTGLTTTADRVHQSRAYPLERAGLPALLIYTNEEALTGAALATQYERRVRVTVEACAKANADLDDTLDQIGKEVEIALAAGVSVGGAARLLFLQSCSFEWDAQEKPYGSLLMTFETVLFSGAAAPDVPL
jgi:hypothetical protein